jgi:hypothetical protein
VLTPQPSGFSVIAPQATIRQAEMLLLVASTTGSSPAAAPVLRQIAAAAYQMEMDARHEIAQVRAESITTGHQWLA